ncbi:3-phosphoshikimate 1-carboxyvinyltransferase [Buchnera aphidicola (Pterocallis alni)]|uniref:3-phosphoshikimate 1-carboxyvinyltransferase n=1 Tax=Buchnera aphidicola TaxID=9 RepID=UPI0034648803
MLNYLTLDPVSSIYGNIHLPGSKSISNRLLLISAIATGKTYLKNLLYSDDVQCMLYALKSLGINYVINWDKKTCVIQGNKNIFDNNNKLSLFLGNAGTAMRPLTAVLALQKREIVLTGDSRMQERPIKDLVDSLRQGGSNIKYMNKKYFPPICVKGGFVGGDIEINSNISSQFLTSLLIAAPLAKFNTNIVIKNDLTSKPYVDMTLKIIKDFGVYIKNNNYKSFFIPGNQQYVSPGKYFIEGDASSASYFLAAAAIKGKSICIHGINKNSIQGDIKFLDVLEMMGAKIVWGENCVTCYKGILKHVYLDGNNIPDAAMTVAILALFANDTSKIYNIYNWRVKETDRLHAMSTELKKIGSIVQEGKDYLYINPPKKFFHSHINTYNDHRMAMCFSLLSLSGTPITIKNPNCVAKTFPKYFTELLKVSH